MSYKKIWVHVVWGTKGRHPFLTNGLRQNFLEHLLLNAAKNDIEVSLVNCWIDHVHCLIRLKSVQSIADVTKHIKGESARWINSNKLSEKRFSWAREYFAASVSEGNIRPVKHYILSQERHHAHRTFKQEVETFFQQTPVQHFSAGQISKSSDANQPQASAWGLTEGLFSTPTPGA